MRRLHKPRHAMRCQTWNYASKGWYFLTMCSVKREPMFGTISDGEMHLNAIGTIIMEEWERSIALRPHMRFETIQVMPDHVHMLVYFRYRTVYVKGSLRGRFGHRLRRSISSFVAQFKATCTRRAQLHHHGTIWQRNYDDQRPCTPPHVAAIIRYIRNNPREAQRRLDQQRLLYNRRSTA